jgi:IclR family mhp operon transcriptional activator
MERQSDVQSLLRGLMVLEEVNHRPGAVAMDIAVACNLPYTTAHRVLRTLTANGFLRREEGSGRYAPASRVLQLANGYDVQEHLTARAQAELKDLTSDVQWPMHFAIRNELAMQIRASTDRFSPLAVQKLMPGQSIPVLQCAAGLAWLAAQPTEDRDGILDAAMAEPGEIAWSRTQIEKAIATTQQRGYAIFRRPQRFTTMVGLSVPIRVNGAVNAALSVRFAESALQVAAACDRFLPRLRAAAARLGSA